ncbi:hypothetical protein FBY35_6325 [Streptomyces sp. SLBN-118]|uniref:hypothetical protein n=1 Tax=Streptomyces sp. SLBN-118 TaxID=2768454 RepID=UPI00114EBD97|nr:hypothetical protein [Streptomyces sp. SLBN-118]TQK44798.1 hypothetical protein FBY35_6325 [Streptomyces sp. SLBN-118]
MRSCSIALRAAGAATVLVLAPAATAAHAEDSVQVAVAPATVVPGDQVAISVSGCAGTTATVTSQAFAADVELSTKQGSQFSGQTTVKAGVSFAAYEVSVVCDGHRHPAKGQIKVVQAPTDQHTPVAPVRAGGGGAANLAVATTDRVEGAGPGTPHAVIGLVLAGVAAIAVAFHGSRRRRTESD